MSSHHIIRENQEPALLIENLSGIDTESLGQLLEWSPRVVVKDTVLREILTLEIHVDLVFYPANDMPVRDLQAGSMLKPYSEDFITEALSYLKTIGTNEVHLIGSLNLLNQLNEINHTLVTLFAEHKKFYKVSSGFSKWLPKNEEIHLPVPETSIQTTGLIRMSDTLYKTCEDGLFHIYFENRNTLILGENNSC